MAIDPALIAAYAPHGNATLAFQVGTDVSAVDEATGNVIETTETLEYLACLTPRGPAHDNTQAGLPASRYSVTGRLLSPSFLDLRITNGAQADCTLNGVRGRLELTFDLGMDAYHRASIRQSIQGTFTVIGGIS